MDYKVNDYLEIIKGFHLYEARVVEVLNDNEIKIKYEGEQKPLRKDEEIINTTNNKFDIKKIGELVKAHNQYKCKYCGYIQDGPSKEFLKYNDGGYRGFINFKQLHKTETHCGIMEITAIIPE